MTSWTLVLRGELVEPPAISHPPATCRTSRQPPAVSHQPSATSHQPPAVSHQPSPTSRQPPAISHQPSATSHQPSVIHQPLAVLVVSHQQKAVSHQPSATSRQPPATSHQPPAISRPPPAKNRQPEAVSHQPSPTSHQPSATSHLPPAVSHQPPAVSHLPPATFFSFLLHQARHCLSEMEFKCAECDTGFTLKHNLLRHMRDLHLDRGDFGCVECGKSFSSKRKLQRHWVIHSRTPKRELELVECAHCYRTFKNKNRLAFHISSVHDKARAGFPCELCGKIFTKDCHRKRHEQYNCLILKSIPCTKGKSISEISGNEENFPFTTTEGFLPDIAASQENVIAGSSGYGWYTWQPPSYSQGSFQWVSCHRGQLPHGCPPVGRDKDGSPLYAGRANHAGDLIPAKVKPNHHGAYVAWGGEEHMKHEYEVLVSNDIAWKHSHDGLIPPQAMIVGHTSTGEKLYFGRAFYDGTITPGKVHPTHRCLYISYDGKEVAINEYEIMVLL